MSMTAIVINSFVGLALIISFIKSRKKTMKGLSIAWSASLRMLPSILLVLVGIGLFLGVVSPARISSTLGNSNGVLGVAIATLLGSVLYIPAILAFPMGASLLQSGASVMSVAAFITTLTMVGFMFIPVEVKELGKRFTLIRNGLSLAAALIIAIVMGLVL